MIFRLTKDFSVYRPLYRVFCDIGMILLDFNKNLAGIDDALTKGIGTGTETPA